MSNVKSITIAGTLPFNCTEHARMCYFLGLMNSPSLNINIVYGQSRMVPNSEVSTFDPRDVSPNGTTALYEYRIFGEEAFSEGLLSDLMQAIIDCGGTITESRFQDLENKVRLKIPRPDKPTKDTIGIYFEVKTTGSMSNHSPAEHTYLHTLALTGQKSLTAPNGSGLVPDPKSVRVSRV